MKTIKTTANQTIFDIAVQHFGTLASMEEIIRNNPFIRNDPKVLAHEKRTSDQFWFELPLAANQLIVIDENSRTIRTNITREIIQPVTLWQGQ